jgi:hypothetical protein
MRNYLFPLALTLLIVAGCSSNTIQAEAVDGTFRRVADRHDAISRRRRPLPAGEADRPARHGTAAGRAGRGEAMPTIDTTDLANAAAAAIVDGLNGVIAGANADIQAFATAIVTDTLEASAAGRWTCSKPSPIKRRCWRRRTVWHSWPVRRRRR